MKTMDEEAWKLRHERALETDDLNAPLALAGTARESVKWLRDRWLSAPATALALVSSDARHAATLKLGRHADQA